ncbi:MAG: hypothetical protein ACR2NZ_18790 [Rubripirellula sp.]
MRIRKNTQGERELIQEAWTATERDLRKKMAGQKQLQLKQLIVLTALASQSLQRQKLQPAYQQA